MTCIHKLESYRGTRVKIISTTAPWAAMAATLLAGTATTLGQDQETQDATGTMASEATDSAPPTSQPLAVGPITVTAPARDERSLMETPASVTVVTQQELQRLQPSTFEDALGTIPGVNIEGGPRGVAQEPNIRGFQDEQVVLTLDGARQNFNRGHSGRFFIDPEILGQIEVIRGGSSSLYGSGAVGGVIALQTKDAPDLLDDDETFGGRFRTTFSSNGNEWFNGATLYGQYESVDGLAFFGYRNMFSDMVDGDGDDIRNSQVDVMNGVAKLGFEPGEDQRLEASFVYYQDNGTIPAAANQTATDANIADRDADIRNYLLSYKFAPMESDWIDLSVLAYVNDLTVTEDRLADGRADESAYRTYGLDVSNRSQLDLGLPVTLTYGFEGYLDTQTGLRDGQVREQFPDAEALYLAGYTQADIRLDEQWTVTPGLRFDYFSLDPDSASMDDRTESQLSPRLTVSYRPMEPLLLWVGWSQAFRAPSLTELYNDGNHFSVTGFPLGGFGAPVFTDNNVFVPNPDLKAETSNQFEAGARYFERNPIGEGSTIQVSGTFYYADVEDYVDQVVTFIDFDTLTGTFPNFTVNGTTTTRNIDAVLYGFEFEANVDTRDWFGGIGLQVPRGEAHDGSALGSIPQERVALTLGYRPLMDVEIGGRATLARGQEDVPADSTTGDGYAVFDLFASYEPSEGPLAGASFGAGIDNVTDRDYRIYPNELDQPGRTFKISAAFEF